MFYHNSHLHSGLHPLRPLVQLLEPYYILELIAEYLANACAFELIESLLGYFFEILYTPLHFVNFAPSL